VFAFLRGIVAYKGKDFIAVDVNGVGYQVFVSEAVQRQAMLHQPITLRTYCYIREDLFQIFGFLREEEYQVFILLLNISGVGPKAALALLSTFSAEELLRAVQDNNVTMLTRAPGIGKKLAQRIVLETKTRLGQDAELSAILGSTESRADASLPTDNVVYEALLALGCAPLEAKRASEAAYRTLGEKTATEELVRYALQQIGARVG
jgi:Holliday junction DNA helicase RuvA